LLGVELVVPESRALPIIKFLEIQMIEVIRRD
jgi:hypothetical protein